MKKIKIIGKNKIYINTFGMVILLIVLTALVYKFAFSQIPVQRKKYQDQTKKELILRQKIELLRGLDSALLEQADLTSFALPNKNPSFAVVSQLKKLAQENSVLITNLKIGAESKDGSLFSSDISFDGEGASATVLIFMKGISSLAPVVLTDKVQINESAGVSRATVRVKSFWAEFPSALPPVSQPATDLTKDEEDILAKIVNLTPPDFVYLEPQQPTEKTNPF